MWRLDPYGTPLDDADAAREELRRRAWLAISDGLGRGRDIRHHRVRVRDENGGVVFEGTLAEAIASDTENFVLPAPRRGETAADHSKRLIRDIETSYRRTILAVESFSRTIAHTRVEIACTKYLVSTMQP